MSTKTPIEPADIRAGDLIRVDFEAHPRVSTVQSLEFTARCNGMAMSGRLDKWGAKDRRYTLLDRPKPAVVLPNESTLGWLAYREQYNELDTWSAPKSGDHHVRRHGSQTHLRPDEVTAFIPATAVPTSALNKLREVAGRCDATYPNYQAAVHALIAAVDKANA